MLRFTRKRPQRGRVALAGSPREHAQARPRRYAVRCGLRELKIYFYEKEKNFQKKSPTS
jgi:hypothetical protein